MERFRADGHLTEESLDFLAASQPMNSLARLEISEHLSFCDMCLQRYSEKLTPQALLVPEVSCLQTLWARTRAERLRLAAGRYTAAVAAVALALTLLWTAPAIQFENRVRPAAAEPGVLQTWTQDLNSALDQAIGRFSGLMDGLGHTFSLGGYPS